MADWTERSPDLAPGPVDPAANPLDPGWARYLKDSIDDPYTYKKYPPFPTLVGVALKTTSKRRERVLIEGDNPGSLFADKKIEVGTGKDYADYTRYRRLFPSITFKWYMVYNIEQFATYSDGTILTDLGRDYWVEIAGEKNQRLAHFTTTRWFHSSGPVELPDGSIGKQERLVPPSGLKSVIPHPWDLDPPADMPPRDLMPRTPRWVSMLDPLEERSREYAMRDFNVYGQPIAAEELGDVSFVDAKEFAKAAGEKA